MYFEYGEKETEHLKSKDVRLAEVIEKVEHINRAVDSDLFSSVVPSHHRSADFHKGAAYDLAAHE